MNEFISNLKNHKSSIEFAIIFSILVTLNSCKNPELTAVKSIDKKSAECIQKSEPAKSVSLTDETISNLVGGNSIANSQDVRALGSAALKISGANGAAELCSAAYIAEGLLVTAAHCLMNSNANGRIEISFGPQMLNSSALLANSFGINQNFAGTSGAHDIAWIKFTAAATPPGYKPATLLSQFDAESGPPQVSLVGYGPSGTRDGNQGVRRAIESSLVAINSANIYPNEFLLPRYLESGTNSCSGDSGGPGFIKSAGEWFLFSVTRGRTFEPGEVQSCEGGRTVVTFIHPYIDWIEQSSGIKLMKYQNTEMSSTPTDQNSTVASKPAKETQASPTANKPIAAPANKQNNTINAGQIAQSIKTASAKTQQKSTTNNCQ